MIVLFIILGAGCLLYYFLQPPVQPDKEAIPEELHITGNHEQTWADHLDWNEG